MLLKAPHRTFKGILLASVAFVSCFAITHKANAADIPGLTPTLGTNSGYTLTSSDVPLSIVLYEIDDQLKATPKFYTLGLAKTTYTYGTGETRASVNTGVTNITLDYSTTPARIRNKDDRSEETISPDGPFYKMPKQMSGSGIFNDTGALIGTINADFFENSASDYGGGLFSGGTINNINGAFVSNTALGGGAINNSNNAIKIGNIKGLFLNNSSTSDRGGAIRNNRDIGSIEADFIGNNAFTDGGAIAIIQSHGKIDSIKGDFIKNSAKKNGGATFSKTGSHIGSIEGNFIENDASDGGALYLESDASIDKISGSFIGNSANNGGAIFAEGAKIGEITGNFIGNSANNGGAILLRKSAVVQKLNANFIGNHANYGVIYNKSSEISSLSGNFIDNDQAIVNENGGLINLVAQTDDIKFSGNDAALYQYLEAHDSSSVIGDAIINLNAASGKKIVINDLVHGEKLGNYETSSYTNIININPTNSYTDGTGTVIDLPTGGEYEFNNLVSQNRITLNNGATLKLGADGNGNYGVLDLANYGGYTVGFGFTNDANGGTLDMANGHIDEQNLAETTLNSTLKLKLDMDVTDANTLKSDTIKLTATKAGTIQLDDITWKDNVKQFEGTIQILKNESTSNIVQLTLNDALKTVDTMVEKDKPVTHTLQGDSIQWDDVYGLYKYDITHTWTMGLAKSDTDNDSIQVKKSSVNGPETLVTQFDNLALINQYNSSGTDRTFNFDSANDVFVSTQNAGVTADGGLIVQGVTSQDAKSTINANGHSLFDIGRGGTVVLENVKVTGASKVAQIRDASMLIVDSDVVDNNGGINASGEVMIWTTGNNSIFKNPALTDGIYLQNGNVHSRLIMNASTDGTIWMHDRINGDSEYDVLLTGDSKGTIKLYNDILNGRVETRGPVTVDTADGKIFEYNFYFINSSDNTKYIIDVDVDGQKADLFKAGNAVDPSGNPLPSIGFITLESLNFINSDFSDVPSNFVVQVIKTAGSSNGLQLALGSSVPSFIRKIGTNTVTLPSDVVQSKTKWSDDYCDHEREDAIFGKLALVKTDSVNDSLGIDYDHTEEGVVVDTLQGDTLELVVQAGLSERSFDATSADETYVLGQRYEAAGGSVISGLGVAAPGTLSVNGIINGDQRSTLDLNSKTGFELTETGLNLSALNLTNAMSYAVYADNPIAVVNLDNVNVVDNLGDDGVIVSSSEVNVTADGQRSEFNNPSAANGIYMNGGDLSLSAYNKGVLSFNDNISGGQYNLHIYGDGDGSDGNSEVYLKNNVNGINEFVLHSGSVTHLGLGTMINTLNMSLAGNQYKATGTPATLVLDVEVDKAGNTVHVGNIVVEGELSGDYNVIVKSANEDQLDNYEDAIVPFLFAENDSNPDDESVTVAAIYGSPYEWEAGRNVKGGESGSIWYLNLPNQPGPGPKPDPTVRSEVMASIGLHEAAIEQTRSVSRNVRNKVSLGREYCAGCGLLDYGWNGKQLRNAWVLAQGETADINKPANLDAKIWGVEAGFDIQNDFHNTLGVFASYRRGDYDLDGRGSKYRSNIGSEIDIDSYLGGLYYRYDRANNWIFATVYGGVQKAEVKSDDGSAKFDSEGTELGGSLELGHSFALTRKTLLEPSLGVYYTQLDFEKARDTLGKEYNWSTIKHWEGEFGVKLSHQFDNANVYLRPSVIQNLSSSDRVRITGLGKTESYHDQTLGRVELGGRYGFTDTLSAYAWTNYTFGSSYQAYTAGLGLNYAW